MCIHLGSINYQLLCNLVSTCRIPFYTFVLFLQSWYTGWYSIFKVDVSTTWKSCHSSNSKTTIVRKDMCEIPKVFCTKGTSRYDGSSSIYPLPTSKNKALMPLRSTQKMVSPFACETRRTQASHKLFSHSNT